MGPSIKLFGLGSGAHRAVGGLCKGVRIWVVL